MGSEDENVTTKRLTAEELAEIEGIDLATLVHRSDIHAFAEYDVCDLASTVRDLLSHIRALDVELERARLAVELAEAVEKYDRECGGGRNWNRMVVLARRVLRPAKTGDAT